ncbi:MAG TPA: urate hydroxylase PuuD [Dongiaceae bacterium]|jgi:uncharacterized membrane protein
MSAFILDWLNLAIRWAHLIAGIGWIGTSFYFIALDLSLRKRARMNEGVYGTAWEVHGGGFYHVEKYLTAPKQLPDDLLWYKWEAYLTWFTGFLLLIVQYYWNASLYLIDPTVAELSPMLAVVISIISLIVGWFLYDGLCRSNFGQNPTALAIAVFALIVAASFAFQHVFSGRGALVHVGALVGTLMAVNVFGLIIPNQKQITAALLRGETPDPRLGAIGKQRSVHNTYLTLPVLLMMVSGHYPMLTGHPQAWLLVALILIAGASIRYFLLRHEVGDPLSKIGWTLLVIGAALGLALVLTAPREDLAAAALQVSDERAIEIAQTHCAMCHSVHPTDDAFLHAPKQVTLDTLADLRRYAALIEQQAVHSNAMPLGNRTGMTAEERRELGAWLSRL